jgi:ATP-dependent exoDNAse (exonuclease V) alpha subunit
MTRELLYTAVTRAKVACYVYGTEETINNTIEKRVKRVSGITSRIITTE